MAKVIKSDIESQTVSSSFTLWKIFLVGILLGVAYWILTKLVNNYVDSTNISGDVMTIIVAVIGMAVMVRLRMAQPLIIACATAASLWGIFGWISGLGWIESILWVISMYGISYVLFSWMARYTRVLPVLVITIIIIITVRIAAVL